jgi:hypothetical protein
MFFVDPAMADDRDMEDVTHYHAVLHVLQNRQNPKSLIDALDAFYNEDNRPL